MTTQSKCAVFGIGHPDRGDDAVGLDVAHRIATLAPADTDVRTITSPIELIDAWVGYDFVFLVDGVRTGAPAGSIAVFHADGDDAPPHTAAASGSHSFGVLEAIDLARSLGRLPGRVTVVGVEIAQVETGAGLSPRVAAAVGSAAQTVLDALDHDRLCGGN